MSLSLFVLVLCFFFLLKQCNQLLGAFGNIKCTLYDLLGHKVLVEWLSLGPDNENSALGLKVGCRGR